MLQANKCTLMRFLSSSTDAQPCMRIATVLPIHICKINFSDHLFMEWGNVP